VRGSWIQQTVTCNPKTATAQAVLNLAALDGVGKKTDFEAVGTEAFCPKGSSAPIYSEYAVVNSKLITMSPKISIVPGHKYEASIVQGTGNNFNYGLVDASLGKTSAANVVIAIALLLYAEIVLGTLSLTVPLAQAKSISFGAFFTALALTCDYDDDGVFTPIGSTASSLVQPLEYKLYDPTLIKLYVTPSVLKTDLQSWTDTIKATG